MTRIRRRVGEASRLALLALLLAACTSEDVGEAAYLAFGGGFISNYRFAEADDGVVVKVWRPLPKGALLAAVFEDPGGGPPLRVSESARAGRLQYVFRSPPLRGVAADRPYRVELRLVDGPGGQLIASYAGQLRSDVDQTVLSARPPLVGPGSSAGCQAAPLTAWHCPAHRWARG